ncbi:TPA: hypothetical protein ACOAY7_002966 [Vibrio cholerae]|nr:hypothetical protein 2017DRC32_0295 [Vibrio phage ICP1]QVV97914.1 hypothetical protein 2017DRC48_0295 [Vibrio phage ICP1]QVV98141.1 hypothetical protein 2017DRC55_0295 [Vibrio phage ICP1]QVV98367.1 hypothetical protein 2017DRC72_0290 [Vibrio phage ICP1]QVV98594.1 hypothetical protein 2017DRC74_0290 [Vibrio phage ICP1]
MIKFRVGDRFTTRRGFSFKIIKYYNATNVIIRFDPDGLCEDGYVKRTTNHSIKTGTIDYLFERSSAGVGYAGYEKGQIPKDKHIKDVWSKMLQRCYKPSQKDKKAYLDCTVCEEWHCYKNFYFWYKHQMSSSYYQEGYQLDKDIILSGNKVYCPEYCRLVPEKINSFLNNFTDSRNTGLPNGVNWKEANKKYQVSIKDENSKRKYLGITNDIVYGDRLYREEKNRIARVLAERYDGLVCPDIINILRNFKYPEYDFLNRCYKIQEQSNDQHP